MPRDLTPQQEENLQLQATKPVFVVRHEHSGVEELASCSGRIVYDGDLYEEGGCSIRSIQDSRQVVLEFNITPARSSQVQNGTWRGKRCRVYNIPAVPGDSGEYTLDEGDLVLDGQFTQSTLANGSIVATATHINNSNRISPRHTWDELSPFCPAVGTNLVWEGDRYILGARESAGASGGINTNASLSARGRLTAGQIKGLSQTSTDLTLTVTGRGTPIDILYGERPVPGKIIGIGSSGSSLVVVVGWCWGEVQSIDTLYINDEVASGAITATHYTGRLGQGVDSTAAAAIPAWQADMVYVGPEGAAAAAYSVITIPSGELSQAPTFSAVIKGRVVNDTRLDGEGMPLYSDTLFSYVFAGDNGATSVEDQSSYDRPITFTGDSGIMNNALETYALGGAQVSAIDLSSTSVWCLEVSFELAALGTTPRNVDIMTCSAASNDAFSMRVTNSGQLRITLSSNGTSWNIIATDIKDLTGSVGRRQHLALYRTAAAGGTFFITLNGAVVHSVVSASNVFSSTAPIVINSPFVPRQETLIRVYSARLTTATARYTAPFPSGGYPFPDSAAFTENPALCAADLASNPIYGMGATVLGVTESADWNDSSIGDSNLPRCRMALLLTEPRRTTDYLDLIAGTYAECVWYNEGADVRIKPDRVVDYLNPSGEEVTLNSDFSSDTVWTKGDGWTISGGVATCDGTQTADSLLTQGITVEDGFDYAFYLEISGTAGTYDLWFNGVINPDLARNTIEYFEEGTATVGVRVSADFVGTVSVLRINRLYWKEARYIKDTLSVNGMDEANAPKSVTARYTTPSGASPNWQETSSNAINLPGVDEGDIPSVATTLYLQGVTRLVEANNKSNARLQRYVNRVQYSWETTDHGYRFRKADVAQLYLPEEGINETVWIDSVEMTSYGRYKVTGFRYSESQYPGEVILPEGTGIVPVGAIVLLSGSTVPDGWASYTDANGRYIIGAGGAHAVGATGGSDTFAGWSGSTTPSDMHSGSTTDTFRSSVRTRVSGSSFGSFVNTAFPDTTHAHTYDTGVITPDLLRRNNPLIIKTGTAETLFPAEAQVFGLPGITAANVSRLTAAAGRLIRAASVASNAGKGSVALNIASSSLDMRHAHYSLTISNNTQFGDLVPNDQYYEYKGGGSTAFIHNHTYNLALNRSVKKTGLALYGGTDSYGVVPGMMVLWAGDINTLPSDWVICDGTKNTPDCRDYFLEIAQVGQENNPSGDNTLSISGSGTSFTHTHKGDRGGPDGTGREHLRHASSHSHTHSITQSASWTPPYFALAVIMYQPS